MWYWQNNYAVVALIASGSECCYLINCDLLDEPYACKVLFTKCVNINVPVRFKIEMIIYKLLNIIPPNLVR